MKRKLLLTGALLSAFAFSAMAQLPIGNLPKLPSPAGEPVPAEMMPKTSSLLGKATVSNWYSLNENLVPQGGYFRALVFPDTFVRQILSESQANPDVPVVDYAFWSSFGASFQPTDLVYQRVSTTSTVLTEHNPFTLDSIAFSYLYERVNPDTTIMDTLVIQFFNTSDLIRFWSGTDANPDFRGITLELNRTTGRATKATNEIKIPLGPNDEADSLIATYAVAAPTGFNVGRNLYCAAMVSYIPGQAYAADDTAYVSRETFDQPQGNILNSFHMIYGSDPDETRMTTHNNGLFVPGWHRYSNIPEIATTIFANRVIPTQMFAAANYADFSFLATSLNVGIEENVAELLSVSDVYPNPVNPSEQIKAHFDLNVSGNVNIEIYDLVGNKVKSVLNTPLEPGTYSAATDIQDLKAGVYFYTVTINNATQTKKFTVVK